MAEPMHIRAQDARGATKIGVMRYVLSFSLGLVVVAMALLLMFGYQG